MGGRGSLSKTPSSEPARASKNQTTTTATARFLTLWVGRLVSACAMMMLSFCAVLANHCICKYRAETKGELQVRLRRPHLAGRFGQQGNPVFAHEFTRLLLGLFPSRDCPLQQPPPLDGQTERLRPGVVAGHDFQPALGP